MSDFCLKTKSLFLRPLTDKDLPDLREILQDEVTMTAYEHAFSEQEVLDWLARQQERYSQRGMGLMAVCRKETGQMIGQCGLTWQEIGQVNPVVEVGYLFKRGAWGRGLASQAAKACRDWAFEHMPVENVYSIIRNTNRASRMVAVRNGMQCVGSMVKHYYGMDMPHDIYAISRREWMRVTGQPGASEAWDLLDEQRRPLHRTVLRRVRLPEGAFHVGVRVVVTDGEGHILLVHSAKKKHPGISPWECPGGAVLSGETSLRAAQRELCEETGIALDECELHYIGGTTVGTCHHDNYLAVKKIPLEAMLFQPGETDTAKWVDFEEFFNMPAGRMPSPPLRRKLCTQSPWRELMGLSK